jgi:hypothetical protein
LLSLLAVLAAPFASLPGSLTSASAATSWEGCQPNRANDYLTYRFDGWGRMANGIGGIYSTIKNYSPWVQPGSSVSAWTMLDFRSSVQHYAQVGWLEYAYSNRVTFVEWTYDNRGGWSRVEFRPQPIDAATYYTTLYGNWAPGVFSYQINGGTIWHGSADFVPNEGQEYGETHSGADQMPGGTQNPEDFNHTNIWVPGSGWIAGDFYTFNSNSNWYNIAKYSPTHLQIGDKVCTR